MPWIVSGEAAGGGSSNADDLTSGLVALARGGTHADLSATGGAGHVLKQASVGADITVGALAISDTTGLQTALDGKLSDTGDTISGDLLLSGAVIKGAAANDTIIDAQSGRVVAVRINGVNYVDYRNNAGFATMRAYDAAGANACEIISSGGIYYLSGPSGVVLRHNGLDRVTTTSSGFTSNGSITINQCARPSTSTVNISTDNQTNRFTMNVPSGGLIAGQVGGNGVFYVDSTVFRTYADLRVDNSGGTQQATLGASGLTFPTAHSTPGGNAVYRTSTETTTLQAAGTGYVSITCNQSSPPRIFVGGTSAGSHPGATCREPAAVSLGAAATRTVVTSATSRNGRVEVINATDNLRASFSVQAGVPTKIEGDASFVAGAPGASQIGLELSSTTLRINNGYAGAKLIAFDYVLNG